MWGTVGTLGTLSPYESHAGNSESRFIPLFAPSVPGVPDLARLKLRRREGRCMELNTTRAYEREVHDAYRVVARHVYRRGRLGEFAYRAFDHVNATHFGGKVPETLILWDLTDHGHCLGHCRSSDEGPPIIKLHPSLVLPASAAPWGIPPEYLGWCCAYDVLL